MEIVPTDNIADAVAQGARLLDELRPGWEHTIRGSVLRGEFDISSWDCCVAGTLELITDSTGKKGVAYSWLSLNGVRFHVDDPQAVWVGFTLDSEAQDANWDELDAQWMHEVEKRIPVEDANRDLVAT